MIDDSTVGFKILFDTKSRIIDYSIKFNQKIITEKQLQNFIKTEISCLRLCGLDSFRYLNMFNEIEKISKDIINDAYQSRLP